MATGEKWTAQAVATSFDSGDIMSIVQGGVNKQLDKDAFIQIFDTGWVPNSDWTNVELVANHNFSANLTDLIVKFFVSSDGTEANAIELKPANNSSDNFGFIIEAVDTDNIQIQTGSAGILYISNSGVTTGLDTESWQYKIKIYYIQ